MSERTSIVAAAFLGLLVALGLTGSGYFISTTLYKGKLASNTVTVKGFAERDVKADLALWQISYSITGGELAAIYAQSKNDQSVLTGFLAQKGFKAQEIKPGDIAITDLRANEYQQNKVADDQRYILKNTITVRSTNVGLVDQTRHALTDLIEQGIALTSNSVDFQFTKLNEIKAPMLHDATENARAAAQQFANDAGSRVGSIQTASQGFFSINSRDSAAGESPEGDQNFSSTQQSTIDKRVRVVVTLTYYLEK